MPEMSESQLLRCFRLMTWLWVISCSSKTLFLWLLVIFMMALVYSLFFFKHQCFPLLLYDHLWQCWTVAAFLNVREEKGANRLGRGFQVPIPINKTTAMKFIPNVRQVQHSQDCLYRHIYRKHFSTSVVDNFSMSFEQLAVFITYCMCK